jgi:undecaprenyl diphosphate synthase
VNICLSYGGRADITAACREISSAVLTGAMKVDDIQEDTIERYLTTKSIPGQETATTSSVSMCLTLSLSDPDILIRTSGEYRVSNFLLWQVQPPTPLLFSPTPSDRLQ